MSEKFTVEIISPEKSVLKTETNMVVIPSYEGEMSILKDHIPLITFLRPGIIKIDDKSEQKYFVEEGVVEFQNNNLLSDFTALENVAIPLIIRGNSYNNSIKKAAEILSIVNLTNRVSHFPSDMSGGEQQRVAIARSLASDTSIILADEPTGNLDQKTSKEIFSYFLKLKKLKKTIIFATHNRELANRADYKLFISDGIIKRVNV